ncbi:MAG: hypothetical protein QXJ59_02430 [Thermofilaceae archaeon]
MGEEKGQKGRNQEIIERQHFHIIFTFTFTLKKKRKMQSRDYRKPPFIKVSGAIER